MTWAEQAAATSGDGDLVAEAVHVFNAGVKTNAATDRVWIHGDLHPRNVLVRDRRLAAVLDWGDLGASDAAVDLAAVWWLFDPADHAGFWSAYGRLFLDLWPRARAWAALLGLSFLTFGMPNAPSEPDLDAHALGTARLSSCSAAKRRVPK
jgi:aminoglycoside phosphotransferase (APT) family kinase protein